MTRFDRTKDSIMRLRNDEDLISSEPLLDARLYEMFLFLVNDSFDVPATLQDDQVEDWILARATANMLHAKRSTELLSVAGMPTGREILNG